jgi:hypothetical protein
MVAALQRNGKRMIAHILATAGFAAVLLLSLTAIYLTLKGN